MGLLTVICPCYNQEKFIRQTLEGFVEQKTDFDFIVLVGDDASTDATPDIVRQYGQKYPDRIRPILRAKNLGAAANANDLYKRVASKYLAICEGDDYWTDERKLQKQIDFLEAHPGCSICFHPVLVWNEWVGRQQGIFPDAKARFNKWSLSLDDLLRHNFIQTNSMVYRWRFKENDLELDAYINNEMQPGDYIMHLLHAETGSIEGLDEVMAVYRRHPGGMWASASVSDQWFLKYGRPFLNFHVFKATRFHYPQPEIIRKTALGIITAALVAHDFSLIEHLATDLPEVYAQAVAALKIYAPLEEKSALWCEGLTWVRRRYSFLAQLTWGRRRERYRRKLSELDSLLATLTRL